MLFVILIASVLSLKRKIGTPSEVQIMISFLIKCSHFAHLSIGPMMVQALKLGAIAFDLSAPLPHSRAPDDQPDDHCETQIDHYDHQTAKKPAFALSRRVPTLIRTLGFALHGPTFRGPWFPFDVYERLACSQHNPFVRFPLCSLIFSRPFCNKLLT